MQLAKNKTTADYTITLAGWEAKALLTELAAVPPARRTALGEMAAGLLREATDDAGLKVAVRRGAKN